MNTIKIIPKFFIWKRSRLYISTKTLPLRKHTIGWNQLLVCIEGEMHIQLENGEPQSTRSCLIKAGTVIDDFNINTSGTILAIYYLSPISQTFFLLQDKMPLASDGLSYDHPLEDALIHNLRFIQHQDLSASQVHGLMQDVIIEPQLRKITVKEFDPRVIETLHNIRKTLLENISISNYAASVHVSESRLKKLFKEQIGIPITKYRIQYRLIVATAYLAAGHSITDAAFRAGFSSSAHFSTCYRDMIGIQPSALFLKPPYMNAYISDNVLEFISQSEKVSEKGLVTNGAYLRCISSTSVIPAHKVNCEAKESTLEWAGIQEITRTHKQ
jgi:AraC-like DNA-binding protein